MSPRVTRVVRALALFLFVLRPGLGSLMTWLDLDGEGTKYGLIYSGLRFDLRCVFRDDYLQHFPPAKLIALVDIPASALTDTVAIPVTAFLEGRRSTRAETHEPSPTPTRDGRE